MKKLIALIFLGMFIAATAVSAQTIVRVRPIHSKTATIKARKARTGHIWIAGHWKWNNRRNVYLWNEGSWMKNRPNHKYVPGHWVVVQRRGHKWIPGHWSHV